MHILTTLGDAGKNYLENACYVFYTKKHVYSEPLLKGTLNKEHNTFNLCIKDKFCGPYRTMAIQFHLLKRTISV